MTEWLFLMGGVAAGAAACWLWLQQRVSHVQTAHDRLQEQSIHQKHELQNCQQKLELKGQEWVTERERASRLEEQNQYLRQQLLEQKEELLQMQGTLKREFQHLSQQLLDQQGEKMGRQNRQLLQEVLDPLKERMQLFEQKAEANQKESQEIKISLKEQLAHFRELGMQMNEEARHLAQALKGSNKLQGNWGEMVLMRLLEISGLTAGREFIAQAKGMGLKAQDGSRQAPDVVVMLPEGKHLVIDAKVSLTAYSEFCSADGDGQEQHLKQHLLSLRNHIENLSSKSYYLNEKLLTPEYVFLFVPIESGFSLALQRDGSLFEEAWGKRVILTGPTSLMATLKTVASTWKIEMQNENAREIAKLGGLLYDQFVGFLDEMEKVGRSLDTSSRSFDAAMRKLHTGRMSLTSRADRLYRLGVQSDKGSLEERILPNHPPTES